MWVGVCKMVATRACEGFVGVQQLKALGVGPSEGVVYCKLKCSGGSVTVVEWVFSLLSPVI